MNWWRSDLISEFGGEDLFKRMLPNTWQWSLLQAVREVARQHDRKLRGNDHDADSIVSLYRLGFTLDERLDDRLAELNRGAFEKAKLAAFRYRKTQTEGTLNLHILLLKSVLAICLLCQRRLAYTLLNFSSHTS